MESMHLMLAGAFFLAALLYSAVGHAGGSGYLAAMAFLGVAPAAMKPTALVLNLLVATIATFRFTRANHFSWALLWPLAIGSIPLAFIGGALTLPGTAYKIAVGAILWVAALRLAFQSEARPSVPDSAKRHMPVVVAILCGALIGLLSGLTGTGGGIFLSPLLLFTGWAETRETGGVSAAFIWLNSAAGLAGNLASVRALPADIPLLAIAAIGGGLIGSELGSRRIGVPVFRRLLALVLAIAGTKLILTGVSI
jgi:uncharacterized protein